MNKRKVIIRKILELVSKYFEVKIYVIFGELLKINISYVNELKFFFIY